MSMMLESGEEIDEGSDGDVQVAECAYCIS